jgi:hypothetical protein
VKVRSNFNPSAIPQLTEQQLLNGDTLLQALGIDINDDTNMQNGITPRLRRDILGEWVRYNSMPKDKRLPHGTTDERMIFQWWQGQTGKRALRCLSRLAMHWRTMPLGNARLEGYFSMLNDMAHPSRLCMKPETVLSEMLYRANEPEVMEMLARANAVAPVLTISNSRSGQGEYSDAKNQHNKRARTEGAGNWVPVHQSKLTTATKEKLNSNGNTALLQHYYYIYTTTTLRNAASTTIHHYLKSTNAAYVLLVVIEGIKSHLKWPYDVREGRKAT